MSMTEALFAISITHKHTPQEYREKLALSETASYDLQAACAAQQIPECVYLTTCNRTEFYGTGSYETALRLLSEAAGVDPSALKQGVRILQGEKAVRHLFKVCAGLDSMVIGEDEILGQTRKAYMRAKEAGYTDYLLNTLFQAAFTAAKRVKTETLLSKSSVSIATLAAADCHKFLPGRKKVLMIGGSGEIGSKMIKNLLSYGDCDITATIREKHLSMDRVRQIAYEERYEEMKDADIVISATGSPHYTVVRSLMEKHGVERKKRLFVDLAVPSDIDSCVLEMEGASLIRIDDFARIAEEHNRTKEQEAHTAEGILREEMDELYKRLDFHGFYHEFERIDEAQGKGFEKFFYEYKKLADAEEFRSFLGVIRKMYPVSGSDGAAV